MNDILRQPVELIDEDLDEVAGGYFDFNVHAVNVGVGQVNLDSYAFGNINVGIGKLEL